MWWARGCAAMQTAARSGNNPPSWALPRYPLALQCWAAMAWSIVTPREVRVRQHAWPTPAVSFEET
jgi:hypothetical protein